ncbi:hypothetical protein BD626DRAFT_547941 [Schizophyllum amplum]|uniref:Uncharacterized protein n=1 Tax=Schizophyllum amplum TaxID=97359 RepID=A0A550CFC4_9AGAR|nr:hypothetical protein BD626DRAFT_547941 [Auriculariopsis ampla]
MQAGDVFHMFGFPSFCYEPEMLPPPVLSPAEQADREWELATFGESTYDIPRYETFFQRDAPSGSSPYSHIEKDEDEIPGLTFSKTWGLESRRRTAPTVSDILRATRKGPHARRSKRSPAPTQENDDSSGPQRPAKRIARRSPAPYARSDSSSPRPRPAQDPAEELANRMSGLAGLGRAPRSLNQSEDLAGRLRDLRLRA